MARDVYVLRFPEEKFDLRGAWELFWRLDDLYRLATHAYGVGRPEAAESGRLGRATAEFGRGRDEAKYERAQLAQEIAKKLPGIGAIAGGVVVRPDPPDHWPVVRTLEEAVDQRRGPKVPGTPTQVPDEPRGEPMRVLRDLRGLDYLKQYGPLRERPPGSGLDKGDSDLPGKGPL